MSQLIIISIRDQHLQLWEDDEVVMDTAISTAKNGPGEVNGSECTPRGWHYVRAKIGADAKTNSVFVGRRFTGEIYEPQLRVQFPERDWILTRILWLSGLEKGKNRLGSVDTMRRYIYIHGCPDEDAMGVPGSHGCIKMHNEDVITLFDTISTGVRVLIVEGELPSESLKNSFP
jgi:lipoprotein-anchoring transpeptidase ErfK/SrfK